eukprot:gene4400-6223_t
MEDLLSAATEKGMYLVDPNNTQQLFSEYVEEIAAADALCERLDPMEAPYKSKYSARERLDKICNKLEATKTIASLEGNKSLIKDINIKISAIKVRLGTIAWECEEPHNTQIELDIACEFYFPNFVEKVNDIVKGLGWDDSIDMAVDNEAIKSLKAPSLEGLESELIVDAMKTLNMLGILWAGRSQVYKSFLYLLAANQFYHSYISELVKSKLIADKQMIDVNNAYTHNLFYLAQAYGNVGDTKKSSLYCHQTLEKQLMNGATTDNLKSGLEWVKNCIGLSDFYMSMKQYNNCGLSLASAEFVLKEHIIKNNKSSIIQNDLHDENSKIVQMEAEVNKKWAVLDVNILKRSFEFENEKSNALYNNLDVDEILQQFQLESAEDFSIIQSQSKSDSLASIDTNDISIESSEMPDTVFKNKLIQSYYQSQEDKTVRFFESIPIKPISLLSIGDIDNFDKARVVFLRAAARIEAAKKYFVLDGFVTDHVTLLQEHSKLYHYIALYEQDPKRKLISYELGETALSLLEIKLDKIRSKDSKGEINIKKLKSTEINKCNDYCKISLAMFAHFTYLYSHRANNSIRGTNSTKPTTITSFETMPLYQLVDMTCQEPDESLITTEEIRPFLNAHFLTCRTLSKVITEDPSVLPPGNNPNKAHFIVSCLKGYQWLSTFAPLLCTKKNIDIDVVFREEIIICNEMIKLLPSKIDRMCYLGESSLSL